MSRRLLLVRHGETAAVRAAAFPTDEPLSDRGRASASALAAEIPHRAAAVRSPAARCRETADALGFADAAEEPRIADADFAGWAGRTLEEVHAEDPEGAVAWMTDVAAAPHGGESFADVHARVGAWLDEVAEGDGPLLAVAHGATARSAVVHALGAPVAALWRIDVAPAALTELAAHDGRWTVRRVNWTPARAAVRAAVRAAAVEAGGAIEPDGRVR